MSATSQAMSQQLANMPALPPPSGVQPNFVDPPSYKHVIIVLEAIFCTLMVLAVAVRVFVRTRLTKGWGWDDLFKAGFGRHLWDIRALTLLDPHNTRILNSNGIVYAICIYFAKVSILLLYLRIFQVNRASRLTIYVGITFISLYYPAFSGLAIASIVKCSGLAASTNHFCQNYARPVTVMNAVINVVTDLYIFVAPIPRVMRLQLTQKRRIGLLIVFAFSLVAFAASLTRMSVFCAHYRDPDILWVQGRNAQFTIVEINVGIMVACASCFPAFFKQSKIFTSGLYSSLRSRSIKTKPSDDETWSALKANRRWSKEGNLLHANQGASGRPTSRGFYELKDVATAQNSHVESEAPTDNETMV